MLKSSVLPPKVLGEDFVSTWGSIGGGTPAGYPSAKIGAPSPQIVIDNGVDLDLDTESSAGDDTTGRPA